MVISQIRSLYRDENDLFRTVIKRIHEQLSLSTELRITRCGQTILRWL